MTQIPQIFKPLNTSFEKNKIDWNKACLTALEEGETLENVHIITLKSYYENLVVERAIEELMDSDISTQVFDEITKLSNSGSLKVRQMVTVFEDRSAIIVIDVPKIDDSAIEQALFLLEKSNIPGVTYFGPAKTYTAEEMIEC